jgi:hypothetical protein
VLEGDLQAVFAGGEHALLELIMPTHSGLGTEEFERAGTQGWTVVDMAADWRAVFPGDE